MADTTQLDMMTDAEVAAYLETRGWRVEVMKRFSLSLEPMGFSIALVSPETTEHPLLPSDPLPPTGVRPSLRDFPGVHSNTCDGPSGACFQTTCGCPCHPWRRNLAR